MADGSTTRAGCLPKVSRVPAAQAGARAYSPRLSSIRPFPAFIRRCHGDGAAAAAVGPRFRVRQRLLVPTGYEDRLRGPAHGSAASVRQSTGLTEQCSVPILFMASVSFRSATGAPGQGIDSIWPGPCRDDNDLSGPPNRDSLRPLHFA